jgi:TonB family protein
MMPTLRTIAQGVVCSLLLLCPELSMAQAGDTECIPEKGEHHPGEQPPIELFAALTPAGDSADVHAIYLGTLLQEVQLAFDAPNAIDKVSDGILRVWLHPDGRLTSAQPADTLLPRELARALTLAIDSVTRRGGIGPVFQPLPHDSVELNLIVHYADQRTVLSLPLLRVTLPPFYFEFQVEKPAMARPGNPAPKYPTHLREGHVQGEVLAQFVVDRVGRAEMRTFKILKTTHHDFSQAARDAVRRMLFYPAELSGCKVRQLVQLPFAFKLNW